MKKKLIITSILSVFLSLLVLLSVSVVLVDISGKRSAEKSLSNYLAIAETYYEPNSSVYTPEKTKELLAGNSSVRLTIISPEGTVKIDTFGDPTENHLDRPEIQNLGVIYYRKSNTLGYQMIYLAGKDIASDGTYDFVRVALPVNQVETTTYSLLGYGFLGIVLITALSGFLTAYLTQRSLRPLQKEVDELDLIVGEEPHPNADTKELGASIAKAKALLDERYKDLANEKEKYETLLDEMEQGLIAFDSQGKIQLVNQAAEVLFEGKKETLLGQDYHVLSTDQGLLTCLGKAMKENTTSAVDLEKGGRIYLVNASPLGESFASDNQTHGVCLLSLDVTEKRKLEEAKRDFFANASHELKSPLTAIIGYQELLQNGTISEKKDQDEALKTTLEEARRMKEIIQEMLVLSKLESGTPREKKDIALKQIVEETLKEDSGWIERKGLHVETQLEDIHYPMAKEDAQNLIGNLIENACKYNKDGGSLFIELTNEHFQVRDTGIGIAEKDQSRIYERFYRVDPAKSKALGGTGLGLSIVKHIALDYDFRLSLQSTLGLGSTFTIVFPKSKK
jgi:two-component system phosphate regulon sensor histidine kinase PhoR